MPADTYAQMIVDTALAVEESGTRDEFFVPQARDKIAWGIRLVRAAAARRRGPNLVTVLGWESCDHTGPVHEGDTLYSELHVESAEATANGGVLRLRALVYAASETAGEPDRPVLDWRFSALQF